MWSPSVRGHVHPRPMGGVLMWKGGEVKAAPPRAWRTVGSCGGESGAGVWISLAAVTRVRRPDQRRPQGSVSKPSLYR